MKIAFFSNYLNHHQMPLAEALNGMDGVDYTFIATTDVPDFRKKLGYQEIDKSYKLNTVASIENKEKALQLATDSDVAIFSTTGMEEYIIPRLKTGKLTFEYSERWFKKNYKLNLLSPKLWKHQLMYYRFGRKANLYMLCASAYAANDYYFLQSYKNRCFKWAYFTQVKAIDIEHILQTKSNQKIRIMWCARFIRWKHPELAIKLASRLKDAGYEFELNMYGNGPLFDVIQKQINNGGLNDVIFLRGSAPNEEIIKAMQSHNVFLFTSDQNEGWGAVSNEAMSNGCTIVGSNIIGSIPYLVDDGRTGLIYKSGDIDSLYNRVVKLITDRKLCENIASEAYSRMKEQWSPEKGAERFLELVDAINNGKEDVFENGPCSKAYPYSD